MALKMRCMDREWYQAATLIQAIWKGFYCRKHVGELIRKYKRGVRFIITFGRGKIDRARARLKKNKAALLLQRHMKRYLVTNRIRYIKCEQSVTATLESFIELTAHVKDQSQRLIRFWWKVHLRIKAAKAEKERKRKAKLAAKKKKKKRGSMYGSSFKSTAAATTPKKPTAPLD